MNEITRIAIDTSKSIFTLHGTDADGRAVLRRNLRRRDLGYASWFTLGIHIVRSVQAESSLDMR